MGSDTNEGRVYIAYGGDSLAATIEVSALGAGGVVLTGTDPDDGAGKAVAMGGDTNRDGYADVLVSAWTADPNGNNASGEVHLIHGGPALPASLDLDAVAHHGVQWNGVDIQDRVGESLAFVGTLNGDGFDAFAIGARFADPDGNDSGEVYVVKGACHALQADGPSTEGETFFFRIHGTPDVLWLLWLDVAILPAPLETSKGPFWLATGIQLVIAPFGPNGETVFPLALPPSGLAGITLYWQHIQQPQGMFCDIGQLLTTTFD